MKAIKSLGGVAMEAFYFSSRKPVFRVTSENDENIKVVHV